MSRFRKSTEVAQQESSSLGTELAVKRQQLQEAVQELEAIDRHSRRQLAVLRWQNAAALVGCRWQQSTVQSGGYTGECQSACSTVAACRVASVRECWLAACLYGVQHACCSLLG